ncbi:MAG: LuxR C-terminal-related transcriptional regulator [Luteolibacter sp.]
MSPPAHQPTSIRVWILEDHDVFAKHLQRLIDSEDDLSLEVRFSAAPELFNRLGKTDAPPNVLLLDLGLPGMNGLEVLKHMHVGWPGVRVLVVSSSDDRENVYNAICNGASGYLLKTADPDEILAGIRDVHGGAAPLSSQVASMILKGFSRLGPVGPQAEPLTSREEEVLRYLVKGLIKKEIADALGISQHTVDMHLRAVYRKLHVRSQTEAVSTALRQGLV